MLNPVHFAKVMVTFEDRIVVVDALIRFQYCADFRFPGSNLMKFLLVYSCRHKGIRRIVLDELQIKIGLQERIRY
jgi:hypothetical protein